MRKNSSMNVIPSMKIEKLHQRNQEQEQESSNLIEATYNLILYGNAKGQSHRGSSTGFHKSSSGVKKLQIAPTPIIPSKLDPTSECDGQSQRGPTTQVFGTTLNTRIDLLPREPTLSQMIKEKLGSNDFKGVVSDLGESRKSNKDQREIEPESSHNSPSYGIAKQDTNYMRKLEELQNQQKIQEKRNKDTYNQQINKLELDQMNMNTRFYKELLKDQSVLRKKKSFLSKMAFQAKEKTSSLFERKDSLIHNIQKESRGPLRRLKQGQNDTKNITDKRRKSVMNVSNNRSFKKISKSNRPKTVDVSNYSKSEIEEEFEEASNSFQFSSDEIEQMKHLERKKKHVSQFTYVEDNEDDDEEINEINIRRINSSLQRASSYLIYPDSNTRSTIDGISFMLLVWISLYVPFVYSFNIDTSSDFLQISELCIDIWFLIEICLNFITCYTEKSVLVMSKQKIASNYIQSWFFLDLVCSIPISFISLSPVGDSSISTNYSAVRSTKLIRILRFARYARLLRLMKFLKVNKQLQALEEFIVNDIVHIIFKFTKISLMVFFLTHMVGCILFTVGQNEMDMSGNSWIILCGIQDSGILEQYITSLYWAFTTLCTVGYGDIHPETTNERLASIFCMIVSSVTFAYIIDDIGRMISSYNLLADQYREKMQYVTKFLQKKEVPLHLRTQVKRYLEYNHQLNKIYKIEESELLSLLNENLKSKITVYLNAKILQNIEVLYNFPIEFLSNLSIIMKKQTYIQDDNIIIEKEQASKLFYIVNGRVSILQRRSMTHIADIDKDHYFGEISFFSELKRQSTVMARDFTDVFIIVREDFLAMAVKMMINDVLVLYHSIRESVNKNPKDLKQLNIKCYICYSIGHIAINCRQFHRLQGNLIRYFEKLFKTKFQKSSTLDSESKHSNRRSEAFPTPINSISKGSSSNKSNKPIPQGDLNDARLPNTLGFPRTPTDNTKSRLVNINNGSSYLTEFIRPAMMEELQVQEDVFRNLDQQINQQKNPQNEREEMKQPQISKLGSGKRATRELFSPGYESGSQTGDQSAIQFDTPPNDEFNSTPKISQRQLKKAHTQLNAKEVKDQKNEVIQEVFEEEDDEDRNSDSEEGINLTEVIGKTKKLRNSNNNQDELERKPLLTQSVSQLIQRPPKSQNDLTKLIGQKKRFASKESRESSKEEIISSRSVQRKIHISGLLEVKKIKTVIKTTTVKTYSHKDTPKFKEKLANTPRRKESRSLGNSLLVPTSMSQNKSEFYLNKLQKQEEEFKGFNQGTIDGHSIGEDEEFKSPDFRQSSNFNQRGNTLFSFQGTLQRDQVDIGSKSYISKIIDSSKNRNTSQGMDSNTWGSKNHFQMHDSNRSSQLHAQTKRGSNSGIKRKKSNFAESNVSPAFREELSVISSSDDGRHSSFIYKDHNHLQQPMQ